MSDELDPALEEFGRRRLIELSEWRLVLSNGTDAERQALIASLREIDLEPLFSTLDEDESDVRATASHQRQVLALNELRRKVQAAIDVGDTELAATLLDLKLNAEGLVD